MRTATGTRRALAVGAATTLLAGLGTAGAATALATVTVDQTLTFTVPAVTDDVPIKTCLVVNGGKQCSPQALPDTPELIATLQLRLSEGSGVSLADGSSSGALADESCNLLAAKTLTVDITADSSIVLSVEGTDLPPIQVGDLVDDQTNAVELCISQT